MGLLSAKKLMKNRRKARWHQKAYKKRTLNLAVKADPLEGASQAKGIVCIKVSKRSKTAKLCYEKVLQSSVD
jgi:small subunit ribosomal protein S12